MIKFQSFQIAAANEENTFGRFAPSISLHLLPQRTRIGIDSDIRGQLTLGVASDGHGSEVFGQVAELLNADRIGSRGKRVPFQISAEFVHLVRIHEVSLLVGVCLARILHTWIILGQRSLAAALRDHSIASS
jgi:hypothetical protein